MLRFERSVAILALTVLTACSGSTAGIGVGIGGGSGGGGVWVQGSPGALSREQPPAKAVTEGSALSVPASAQLSEGMRIWLQSQADLTDLKAINYGLEHSPQGESMGWRNFDTGRAYSLTPGEYKDVDDRRCRNFELGMTQDGTTGQSFSGSACRGETSQWSLEKGV